MIGHYKAGVWGLIFLIGGGFFAPAIGFDFISKTPGKLPIEIDSRHGITCVEKGRVCTAQGDVVVTHGQTEMRSDTLTATFTLNEKGLPTVLNDLEARGNVRFTTKDKKKRGTAGRAVYTVATGQARFTGGNLSLILDDLKITAQDSLTYFEKENRAVATGRAQAQKDTSVMTANTLTAFFQKKKSGPEGGLVLNRVTAEGEVLLTTPKNAAQGDQAVYTPATEIAQLKGNVRLVREEGQLEGAFAEMNLATGVSEILNAPRGDGSDTVAPEDGGAGQGGTAPRRGRVKVLLQPRASVTSSASSALPSTDQSSPEMTSAAPDPNPAVPYPPSTQTE